MAPGMAFGEFASLFLQATGYTWDDPCLRNFSYSDPALRSVADELLLLPRMFDGQEVVGSVVAQEGNPDYPRLVDIRFSIACLIFPTLNDCNPSLQRACKPEDFERLVRLIALAIPPSRRWIVLPPTEVNADLLVRYHRADFSRFTAQEYRYVNILEDDNIGWIATYGVDEGLQAREPYNEAFAPFVQTLGLSEFSQYTLPLHLDSSYYEDPVTPRGRVVGSWFLKQYAARMGVAPERLVLTPSRVHSMQLSELPTSFIPIFAQVLLGEELEDVLFMVDEPMIEVNNPGRLCYSLPAPREVVLKGIEKGHVFETFVHRFLKGDHRVVVLHGGGSQPFPDGFIRTEKPERKTDTVVKYSYRPPTIGTGFRVTIEGPDGSPLHELARSVHKPRTELDVLLVHDEEPSHVLVGECKFGHQYRGDQWARARLFAERIAKAIGDSSEIRDILGLPHGLPIVAAAFVSHSGPCMTVSRPSVIVPMTHLLSGQFKEMVKAYLAGRDASGEEHGVETAGTSGL